MRRSWLIELLAAALVALSASAVRADVTLTAAAGAGPDNAIGNCSTAPSNFTCSDQRGKTVGSAVAVPGQLSVLTGAFTEGLDGLPSQAFASASYTDTRLLFSVLPGFCCLDPGGLYTTSLNLSADGNLGAVNLGVAEVDVTASFQGVSHFHARDPDPENAHYDNTFTGLTVVYPTLVSGIGKSQDVQIPLNTPVTLQIGISAMAYAPGVGGGSTAGVFFEHTVRLPVGIDVFNLPAGITVNAPDSFIVNNRYLPEGITPAVPEPETWALIMAGVALLTFRTRRVRR